MPYSSFGRPATALSADVRDDHVAERPDVGAVVGVHDLRRAVLRTSLSRWFANRSGGSTRWSSTLIEDQVVDIHGAAALGEESFH